MVNNFPPLSAQQKHQLPRDPVLFAGIDAALRMADDAPGAIGDTHACLTDRIARGCALLLLDASDRPFASVCWTRRAGLGLILSIVAPFGDRAQIVAAARAHLAPASEPGFVFCPGSATELQQLW
ncbi:hypothetical protein [Tateyamaria omphalii]|uniref:Uncharacterized protein n=1 Tax=Tateyamaria omphalii TaxID=299262 RepID=A0A1P8MTC8_9RHOB|nr:hypothetical protein [Tateyamaria omphalii]APX11357.1 hypothetical protein BWR18_06440 [Tateyamaria omphalii]